MSRWGDEESSCANEWSAKIFNQAWLKPNLQLLQAAFLRRSWVLVIWVFKGQSWYRKRRLAMIFTCDEKVSKDPQTWWKVEQGSLHVMKSWARIPTCDEKLSKDPYMWWKGEQGSLHVMKRWARIPTCDEKVSKDPYMWWKGEQGSLHVIKRFVCGRASKSNSSMCTRDEEKVGKDRSFEIIAQ